MAFSMSHKKSFASNSPRLTFPEFEDVILLDYVAVDSTRLNSTTKTYVAYSEPKNVQDCPVRYTSQYDTVERTTCLELALRPIAMYRDPFRQGKHKIVFCELDTMTGKPLEYNTRNKCKDLLDSVAAEEPWFGFEQEYFLVDEKGIPLDYEYTQKHPETDCATELEIGGHVGLEREMAEVHLQACIYAGLTMFGTTREMVASMWEYQMGPTQGIVAADELHVSRYILRRIAEMYGVNVMFGNPDCLKTTLYRCNLNLNFSTKSTRQENGIEHIYRIVKRLEEHPQENLLKHYDLKNGEDAKWRLCGEASMPSIERFECKVGDKERSSVRIPTAVYRDKKGYIEERRVSSEADPYDVIRAFVSVALFDKKGI